MKNRSGETYSCASYHGIADQQIPLKRSSTKRVCCRYRQHAQWMRREISNSGEKTHETSTKRVATLAGAGTHMHRVHWAMYARQTESLTPVLHFSIDLKSAERSPHAVAQETAMHLNALNLQQLVYWRDVIINIHYVYVFTYLHIYIYMQIVNCTHGGDIIYIYIYTYYMYISVYADTYTIRKTHC